MVLRLLTDLLLPTRCACCKLPGAELCLGCRDGMVRPAGPRCARCGHPWARTVERCPHCPTQLDRLQFAVDYVGPARALIRALKDERQRAVAQILAEVVADAVTAPRGVLVPVPTSAAKLRERGFNPAELIARRLGRIWGCEVAEPLSRAGVHRDQRGASVTRRRDQVRGAFVAPSRERWPPLVVVDDVLTTGATISACALALRRAGARHVQAIAAARVLPP